MNELGRVGTSELELSRGGKSVFVDVLRRSNTAFLIAAAFALLHIGLVVAVDLGDPALFLRADRADERLNALLGLLTAEPGPALEQYLATHGILGDYAAHALLYLLGGRLAIVIVQVALALVSGLCVYRIGSFLELSARARAAAMTLYLMLPHTLVFPHQLASEALHIPLLVISTWLLVESFYRPRLATLVAGGVCLALATFIRPIMLLWPFVAAGALAIVVRPRAGVAYAVAALLPVLAWMSFIGMQTGDFGLGKSSHGLERNLYERVERITATLSPAMRAQAHEQYLQDANRELGPVTYMRFSIEYPGASLKHLLRDGLAFFGKSGIERITIDYLALSSSAKSLQDPERGWRRHLEEHGIVRTTYYLAHTLGAVFFISLIGAALTVCLTALAIVGAAHFAAQWRALRKPRVMTGLLLAVLIIYVFWFSQVINAMQSRHRAPAEFALVLLAVVGWGAWRARRSRRRLY